MSTRSSIAIQMKSGAVLAVYCHFDGYLEGVGETLVTEYDSYEKAYELVRAGDMSSPGEPYDWSEDFGEVKPHSYSNFKDYKDFVTAHIHDNGFRYIFMDDHWHVWGTYDLTDTPILVEKALAATEKIDE